MGHPNAHPDESRPLPTSVGDSASATDVERREELDDLIYKAQELVRNLDTISLTAAPEMPTTPSAGGEPQTIADLDHEIASNLDQALQSHFQTVDAVLDTVFEEQAAIVQQINQPLPAELPTAVAEAPKLEEKKVSAAPVAPTPVVAEVPPVVEQELDKPAESVDLETASDLPVTNALDAATNIEPPAESALIPAEFKTEGPKNSGLQKLVSIGKKAAQPAVPLLVVINYPLRLVPQTMRSAVDWIALTLLVWVPIVWIMVFTFGQPAGEDETHDAQSVAAAKDDHSADSSKSQSSKSTSTHKAADHH